MCGYRRLRAPFVNATREDVSRYAALAVLNARTLRDLLASELGVALDPSPFLAASRGEAARDALLRLLALPRDEAFNRALDEKAGREPGSSRCLKSRTDCRPVAGVAR